MARRTSRLKAKKATAPAAHVSKPSTPASDVSASASHHLEDADDARPARKRQRTTAPAAKTTETVKKRRGHLKMLAEMPVDVLLEIFSHMHPVDVLHLTWTSKELRALLMRRSAISVWRGAFETMPDVPECPADQTLPQWTRLLFVAHCHFCLVPGVTTILFTLRMRACQKCNFNELVTRIGYLDTSLCKAGLRPDESFPCISSLTKVGSGRSARWQLLYLRAQIKDTEISCLEALKEGKDAFDAFLAQKRAENNEIEQHARVCDEWYEGLQKGRAGEHSNIRFERKSGIVEKLKQLGYDADVNYVLSRYPYSTEFERHALVHKSQKLTPKVWANIQQAIIDHILEYRPQRLEEEHRTEMKTRGKLLKDVLAKYRTSLPSGTQIPPDGDIADSAAFRSVWDIDPHSKVYAEDFNAVLATIPGLFEPWTAAVESALLKMLGASEPSVLQLATSVFVCRNCSATVVPRDAREHACLACTAQNHFLSKERDRFLLEFYNALNSAPWNWGEFIGAPIVKAELSIRPCVEELVGACGLDPTTATHSDMDAANATFTCARCAREGGHYYNNYGQTPMKWSAAIPHHVDCHAWGTDKPPSFMRTTRADETVQAQEQHVVHSVFTRARHTLVSVIQQLPRLALFASSALKSAPKQ